ncbi:MAG TPA: sigma-54 dependent transcriptional regulator [Thermodesulfovibrionales bacterium]|nr:sigma-54 dependent transcriptional regulator [Thermodesulfovibrionales bacterium]
MAVVLVVDDEPLQRDILKTILSEEGYETHAASSGEEALKLVKTYNPDVVLTDLKMEGMDGVELLERIKSQKLSPEVLIMTAYGTIPSVVEAMQRGAYGYLEKPLAKDRVLLNVKHALEKSDLLRKNQELQRALTERFSIEGIVGHSKVMDDVIHIIRKVSHSPVTVLILGESGTGKELVARAIHYNSPRSTKPFTAINCAAIPESLLESELFGYEPGAFTGATTRKTGLFEASNGGTMFLDEVGDLPPMTQSKILRVLQEREVRRIGGRDSIKVDVRIIAATNKDLEKEMKNSRFREDLYYRLRVVAIDLPPLRERDEDIPDLVAYFLERYNNEFGKRIKGIEESAMKSLIEYHWPGNIRQLESVIERAVLMCESDSIRLKDIKSELRSSHQHDAFDIEIPEEGINFEELEKDLLKKAMNKANNVAAKAARLLGMSYKTFWYRWEKFNLEGSSLKREESS